MPGRCKRDSYLSNFSISVYVFHQKNVQNMIIIESILAVVFFRARSQVNSKLRRKKTKSKTNDEKTRFV